MPCPAPWRMSPLPAEIGSNLDVAHMFAPHAASLWPRSCPFAIMSDPEVFDATATIRGFSRGPHPRMVHATRGIRANKPGPSRNRRFVRRGCSRPNERFSRAHSSTARTIPFPTRCDQDIVRGRQTQPDRHRASLGTLKEARHRECTSDTRLRSCLTPASRTRSSAPTRRRTCCGSTTMREQRSGDTNHWARSHS